MINKKANVDLARERANAQVDTKSLSTYLGTLQFGSLQKYTQMMQLSNAYLSILTQK